MLTVEAGYAFLLAAAFVLPAFVGYRAWIPALGLAIFLAAAHGAISRRRPVISWGILAYMAIYVVAALDSDPQTFSIIEAGKYFAPPILTLAVAWAATERTARQRLILLAAAAVAIQLPVVITQVTDLLLTVGRDNAIGSTDSVTGLLGSDHPGTLTQCGIFVGLILLARAYLSLGAARLLLIGIGILLVSLTAFTSTRAGYVFAFVAFAAMAVFLLLAGRRFISRRTLQGAFVVALVIAPFLAGVTGALYPGANAFLTDASSVAYFGREGTDRVSPSVDVESENGDTDDARAERRQTVLPGRAEQIRLAAKLSVNDGWRTALFGRGIGATRFKQQAILSETGATSDPITREEQRTNGLWISRTLTETGMIGLLAFFALLGYAVAIAWRNRGLLRSAGWDGAVILALPGIALLTLVSGLFNTVLAIQPYATLFWPLLGIALAATVDHRSDEFASQDSAEVDPARR